MKNIQGGMQQGSRGPQKPDLSQDEIDDLDALRCGECGSEAFISALQMKVIPSVHPASPAGSGGGIQPVQVFACLSCGKKADIEEIAEKQG